jgi:hypothetical protein
MKFLTFHLVLGSLVLPSVVATGNPATFWSDYPTCEDDCHQSVWSSQSCSLANSCSCSGCLCLADSCLCETSSWLTAVAQCIGEQCGSSGVIDAASIASSACAGAGYPLVVPSASLVSIGLAALPATSTQETTVKSSISSETGGDVAQTVASTAMSESSNLTFRNQMLKFVATVTNTPTSQTVPAVATTTSSSATVVEGASSKTTSNLSSTRTSVASASSPLSSGAKAGIGIGAALAVIIIIALLAFIFYQRRRHSKLGNAVPAKGTATSTGIFELNGAGRAFSGMEKNNMAGDRKRPSGLQGGGNSVVSPASQAGVATFPEEGRVLNVAEMAVPLSVEEKQELERRRRATELSGAGLDIPVETGIGERNELEARRRVYEMA